MKWKTAIIISVCILLAGIPITHTYWKHCIIENVEQMLATDPTAGLNVKDFKSVQEYARMYNEIEAKYEQECLDIIAKNFSTTPERVKEIYFEYIENK